MAFASPRTYHRVASQIEECGFDIKDMICWVYGQDFAKAQDIGKSIDRLKGAKRNKVRVAVENCAITRVGHVGVDRPWIAKAREQGFHEIDDNGPVSPEAREWAGWKTALKPAHEPIVVAQKPIERIDGGKSIARNVLKYGTGGMDIDGNRVPFEAEEEEYMLIQQETDKIAAEMKRDSYSSLDPSQSAGSRAGHTALARERIKSRGRYDGDGSMSPSRHASSCQDRFLLSEPAIDMLSGRYPCNIIGEIEEHQRYFYNPQYDLEIDSRVCLLS
jgi:hypothetical protein